MCRKYGVLRLAEPGSGENLSCVVVFILVSQIEFFKPIKGLLAGFEVNLFKVSCVLNSQVSFTFSDYLCQQVFRYCHLFKFWIQFRLQKKVGKQISCIVPLKKCFRNIIFHMLNTWVSSFSLSPPLEISDKVSFIKEGWLKFSCTARI